MVETKPPLTDPKVVALDNALAFLTLWEQEYAKNPELTLTQFRKHLHDTHASRLSAAKAALAQKKGQK